MSTGASLVRKAKPAVLKLLSAMAGRSQSESSDESSSGKHGYMEVPESSDCLPLPLPFESREEDLGRVLVLPCFSLCSSLAFSKAPLWPFGRSPLLLESTALYVWAIRSLVAVGSAFKAVRLEPELRLGRTGRSTTVVALARTLGLRQGSHCHSDDIFEVWRR